VWNSPSISADPAVQLLLLLLLLLAPINNAIATVVLSKEPAAAAVAASIALKPVSSAGSVDAASVSSRCWLHAIVSCKVEAVSAAVLSSTVAAVSG